MRNARLGLGALPYRTIKVGAPLFLRLLTVLPRRRRFEAMTGALRVAERLFPGRFEIDWPLLLRREWWLYQALERLDRAGIGYDADVRMEGLPCLEEAARGALGALVVAPHTHPLQVVVRHLFRQGMPITAVAWLQRPSLAPVIVRERGLLFDVREALARGTSVFAMIDCARAYEGWTTPVETRLGTVHLSDAMIRVAVRLRAPVVFAAGGMHPRGVWARFASPAPDSAGDAGRILSDFAGFLQEHAERTARGAGVPGG